MEESTLPTVNTPVENVQVKSTNNSFLVTLLSILLLLSVSIAGFFAYQTQNLVKELSKLQTVPINITPTATPVSTENWETYTSQKYKFSVQYPKNLGLEAKEVDIKSNYEEYLKKCQDGTYEGCGGMRWPDHKISFLRKNGSSAFDVRIWDVDLTETIEIDAKVSNGKTFMVSTTRMFGEDGDVEPIDKNILDQISKTLTFTSEIVACTMEAKICPDGSAVGRSGPKCEFAACPTAKPTSTISPLP